jgi:LysM domain
MTPVSIVKIVASASVFAAAGSAALVFGIPRVQHEDWFAADAVTATTSAPQAAPAVVRPLAATGTPPAQPATQAPAALAATGADPATIATQLAGPPEAAAKDASSPSFDIARIEAGGDAVIGGRAAPGATVDLLRGDERLDRAVADASGQFVMVPSRLPAGSYELTLSARLPGGTVTSSRHGVAVTINDAAPSAARAAQSRAEYVPEAASQPRSSPEPRLRADKAQDSGGSKIVIRGDSLWRISRILYGDGGRYALLYRANRNHIRDPNLIYPGQALVLPAKRD